MYRGGWYFEPSDAAWVASRRSGTDHSRLLTSTHLGLAACLPSCPRTRFAPVKTCADLFCLRSDAYVVTEDYRLELAPSRNGATVRIPIKVLGIRTELLHSIKNAIFG